MKIIVSSQDESHRVTFALNIWLHLVVPAILLAVVMGVYVTTQLKGVGELDALTSVAASKSANKSMRPDIDSASNPKGVITNVISSIPKDSDHNHRDFTISNEEVYKIDVNILARRLGVLEAESLRLNAFGSRIVKMAKLDPEEFAFEKEPSVGGVLSPSTAGNNNQDEDYQTGYGIDADELMESINSLEKQLIAQRNRLEGMLQVLNGRILDREVMPSGMPIEKGYISSKYGFRRDPFSGRKRLHKGIDFAGREGTPVKAVAGGVVQFAGKKGGYGNIVEVDHGNGLVSRYAHLSVINVNADQIVKKGDAIAQVGSTGRSTGPHLHLEVLKNGKHQNPAKYF